ncbi:RagB/SusD family nutrient uptake outer membrane protein [Chitinophaga polysaccharea]|uniref:RagB/SusD family nutrient uptake outer membrane protein n=1 Tax=Chitinophaga polysaccharea TaxID=1293035 RepID=UPI00115ADA0B|nr:RagB/SusD family nutrient uptake outer membrane protein [Chitinophaga polysaccharea]
MSFINIIGKKTLILFTGLLSVTSSCKKFIDTDGPITSISGKNVYDNDATSIAVLTGIYTKISQSSVQYGGSDFSSIGYITGLLSDELTLYIGNTDPTLASYYENAMSSRLQNSSFWNTIYNRIYIVNSAIEGLNNAKNLTESIRVQLMGEAKFIRALCYFYLVNLYGDIPLVTSPDYTVNMSLSKSPQGRVWAQIILDLTDAKKQLSANFLDATLLVKTDERVRPTQWAAIALLARSYLYTKDWDNAEKEASILIEQSDLFAIEPLNNEFKKNNREAIWQLQPVLRGWNTEDAKAYIIPKEYGPNGASGVYISTYLLNAYEVNDKRKSQWLDSIEFAGTIYPFAYKYQLNSYGQSVNEYNTVLRLSEQYLIRAEARANLENFPGALEDIKKIREKAGLTNITFTTKTEILSAILHERQVELFTEYGHRWFDLKRTNNINTVMNRVTADKGGNWTPNGQWFPIPFYDTQTNTNIQQNPGY